MPDVLFSEYEMIYAGIAALLVCAVMLWRERK